jgi:glycosyltransferase involved in cell wall biosynthesis
VQPSERPRGLGAGTPVGELDVVGDVVALAVVGLDPLDPKLERLLGLPAPPRLGEHATFLGWVGGDDLPRTYASADLFLFASQTDTYWQVIVEAQASGLPVVAVDEGGPASLIEHGETGLLVPADAEALARELLRLTGEELLRERIRRAALAAVSGRTWETALEQLAVGYRTALHESTPGLGRKVA